MRVTTINKMNMILPPYLTKGARIGIVATARKISMREIKGAIEWMHEQGFKTVLGETIEKEAHQFAGTDLMRSEDLQRLLDDNTIDAIWCARGGYGTVRIIDALDFTEFKKHPKWIIGYSDVTILHSHIHKMGIATLHGPMAIDLLNTILVARNTLHNALIGKSIQYKLKPVSYNRKGKGNGQLIGGNLSILYSVCGSPSQMDTKGKVLFIEDLDEYLYHIDRMLQNMKRSGMLENLEALIVGGMTKMHDNTIPFGKTAEEIILDTVKEYDYPVVFEFPAGHVEANHTLLLGREVEVDVSADKVNVIYK